MHTRADAVRTEPSSRQLGVTGSALAALAKDVGE
jgi:hypothetical protein